MHCEDEDAIAPRDRCRCRECYLARERALDERLIQMMRGPAFMRTLKRSDNIIHQTVRYYLAGECDIPTLYIELIKRLAADGDDMFDRVLEMTKLMHQPKFIPI